MIGQYAKVWEGEEREESRRWCRQGGEAWEQVGKGAYGRQAMRREWEDEGDEEEKEGEREGEGGEREIDR